jgi:succinate dehydrogenase hydrophobic anchor subunit
MTSPSEPVLSPQEAHEKALHVAHHTPWLHVPRHIKKEQIHAQVHGTGPMGRVNAWLAFRITKIVGTMYCAYVFTILAFVALPSAIQQGSPTVLVNWLSSNFLQLVLLPIIIVGQNVISAAQDARAEADHETLTALNQMNIQQLEILKTQEEILTLLKGKAD